MKKAFFFVCCLLISLHFFQCSRVFNTVCTVGSYFVSDSEEVQMGNNFHQQIISDTQNFPLYENKPNHNPQLVHYIDSLGQLLATRQRVRPDIDYHFTIIDNDTTVNAFATPGGFVYIYTGLIKNTQYESEIAGVLGHELGHIAKRHGVKLLMASSAADFILDLIVGDSTALRTVIDITNGLSFLKYSRDNEYQADSLGVEFEVSAGLNPIGMKTFMQYLASLGEGVFEPLATHPDGAKRVEAIDRIIASKGAAVVSRPNPLKRYDP